MILRRNRLFSRQEPARDAKCIYIFCEGIKTEYNYFRYFQGIDSRIKIEIHKLNSSDDNSPSGLLTAAINKTQAANSDQNPEYEVRDGDEVWLVFDTDEDRFKSRAMQVEQLRKACRERKWSVAQSNPCFEVWLYYHFYEILPGFDGMNECKKWKRFLSAKNGGFDSRKHTLKIQTAIKNATQNYKPHKNQPDVGSTEVYNLANSILSIIGNKLNHILEKCRQN